MGFLFAEVSLRVGMLPHVAVVDESTGEYLTSSRSDCRWELETDPPADQPLRLGEGAIEVHDLTDHSPSPPRDPE